MSEPKQLARSPRGSLRPREEGVHYVAQTKAQRRGSLAIMLGGIGLISMSTVGSSTVAPLVLGAMLGTVSTKVRTMGRGRLLRAVKQLDDPHLRAGALAKLEALALEAPLITTSVRMEAAGHVALARVETGALGEALEVLARAYRDRDRKQRQRLPDQGFLGELVHALLTRLAPSSVLGLAPVPGSVNLQTSISVGHRDYALVRGMLRALDGAAAGGVATALGTWHELQEEAAAPAHPVLVALVGAALFSRLELGEAFEDELLARVEGLAPAQREALTSWYPRLSELGRQGYRAPARAAELPTALVPRELQGLSTGTKPSRWLPAVARRNRVVVGIATGVLSLNALFLFAAGDPTSLLFVAVVGVLFTPMLISTPILRRRRVALLVRAGVLTSEEDPRRQELERMPARSGPAHNEAAALHPFELTEIRLLVGLARAQQSLAAGDLDGAQPWVEWWMETAKEQGFGGISTLAIGAAALRTATMTGQREAAKALARALKQGRGHADPRVPRAPRVRTGHGDAPRAVSAASALHLAASGDLQGAGSLLRLSASEPAVAWDAFERDLYGRLGCHLAAHEVELPSWVSELSAQVGEGPGYLWPGQGTSD